MPWEKSSDGEHKDKIKVDLEKGRVTHERISTDGVPHEHEWSESRPDGTFLSGWRGKDYKEDETTSDDDSEDSESEEGGEGESDDSTSSSNLSDS